MQKFLPRRIMIICSFLLKFGLSEKHTKFEKIFLMVLTNQLIYLVNVKTMRNIFSNYVCFSKSPNFKIPILKVYLLYSLLVHNTLIMKLTNDSTCQAQWVEINSEFAFMFLWTCHLLACGVFQEWLEWVLIALNISYKSSVDDL